MNTELVLKAFHVAGGGPLNYVGILDRIGGSKDDLEPILSALVSARVLKRDVRGYSLAHPLPVMHPVVPPHQCIVDDDDDEGDDKNDRRRSGFEIRAELGRMLTGVVRRWERRVQQDRETESNSCSI